LFYVETADSAILRSVAILVDCTRRSTTPSC
jgi:hypothetical protein